MAVNPASITLGGGLASRLPPAALLWIVLLGSALLITITIACGLIGRRNRASYTRWTAHTFGLGLGALLLNGMMALGMSGWSGFQLGLGGTGLGNLIGLPAWGGPVTMALLVLVLGNLNVNRWNVFVWITTLSALGLAITALFIVSGQPVVEQNSAPLTAELVIWAVGSIVSYAAFFSLRSTDFSWDMATDRDVVITNLSFLGLFLTSLTIGVLLYRTTGDWDLAQILAGTRMAALGQMFLFVSLMSPALSTLHSGSLAWSEILPTGYRTSSLLLMVIGLTLGLLRFDRELLTFLDWIGVILPPAMVVLIAAGWLKRKFPRQVTLTAWLVGAAVAIAFKLTGQEIHLMAGALTAAVVLAVGLRIERRY